MPKTDTLKHLESKTGVSKIPSLHADKYYKQG